MTPKDYGEPLLPLRGSAIDGRIVILKNRILTIIAVGITIGFLLGMGVSALLRTTLDGGDKGLELAFTALVSLMVGALITYVAKTVT